jgi:hypothetical protein
MTTVTKKKHPMHRKRHDKQPPAGGNNSTQQHSSSSGTSTVDTATAYDGVSDNVPRDDTDEIKMQHSTAALELASAAGHAGVFSNDNLILSGERCVVPQQLQFDIDVVDTREDTGNNDNINTAADVSNNVTDTSVGVRTFTDF